MGMDDGVQLMAGRPVILCLSITVYLLVLCVVLVERTNLPKEA